MDDNFFEEVQRKYKQQVQERQFSKFTKEFLKDLDERNENISYWLNDLEKKHSEALETIATAEPRLKEVEQELVTLSSKEIYLKKKVIEMQFDTQRQKQQFLHRKDKAKAKLSQKDVDFIDSLEKRLLAFKKMTGICWVYEECEDGSVSGFIRNVITGKKKFFRGNLSADDIWCLIEEICKEKKN